MFSLLFLASAVALTPQAEAADNLAYTLGRCHMYLTSEAKVSFFKQANEQPVKEFGERLQNSYYQGIQDSRTEPLPTLEQCRVTINKFESQIDANG